MNNGNTITTTPSSKFSSYFVEKSVQKDSFKAAYLGGKRVDNYCSISLHSISDLSLNEILVQGDNKKHANLLFFTEIMQSNLPKFAYNLIIERRVRI